MIRRGTNKGICRAAVKLESVAKPLRLIQTGIARDRTAEAVYSRVMDLERQ
jgi:hypothetical protein